MTAATEPVTPRPAASLLLLRETPDGPEVLMGMRGASHRFMPNRLVFPGGAVDPCDATAPAATEPPPATLRLLALEDVAAPRAIVLAAARELDEETGLSLGRPPRLDAIFYLCRAVTPEASPMRFDARFLVVPADRAEGVVAGSGELERVRYYGVAEAMALDLAFVTHSVLERLLLWRQTPPEAREARRSVPVMRERGWIEP